MTAAGASGAIAHRYPATDFGGKPKAPALAAALQALITAQPHVLPAVALDAAAAEPVAAAAADSDASDDEDTEDEESQAAIR